MFERLLIQNFQAHDKLRIDFDPHITTIVGPSDGGKSAIIRALRWVCANQPGGDTFVRYGTKGATVKLLVDGHAIARRRSPGGDVNTYVLDGKELKAFGRGVPEPILKILNLGEVCWQQQHDAAYWFSETAGEVSRRLNAIVNLSIIDDTLAGVARVYNRARTRLEVAEEDLTEAKTNSDALAWAEDFDGALSALEAVGNYAEETRQSAATAARLVQGVHTHRQTHERTTTAAQAGQTMVQAGKAAVTAMERAATGRFLVHTAKRAERDAERPVPSTEAMQAAVTAYTVAQVMVEPLQRLIDGIHAKETTLCQLEKDLKKAVAAVPKQCPTCGQSLSQTSTSKPAPQ